MDHFLHFYRNNNLENKNFEKKKKKKQQQQQQKLKISSFYTCVPQMATIWSMAPEIPRATARIFCLFEPFFSPFYSSNNSKKQNFWKIKKEAGDIIVMHMPTTMVIIWYVVSEIMELCWDMERKRQPFCHFRLFFTFLPH